ncbi:MAG: A24 family peptidase, partial [Lachnospiraceae bacterium]|nr:A24 family peptidase [Lachnospiraceae bacterium]
LWIVSFACFGFTWDMVLVCFLLSALLTLSVIDFRTYEIPFGINVFIGILGFIRLVLDYENWVCYIIGLFAVSVFLLILLLATKGRGIGGGDVKLMAAAGLFLGWKLIILAFILGCFYGSVIHIIRMKIAGEGRVLAMGPYLSMGIVTALVCGNRIIEWYISMF